MASLWDSARIRQRYGVAHRSTEARRVCVAETVLAGLPADLRVQRSLQKDVLAAEPQKDEQGKWVSRPYAKILAWASRRDGMAMAWMLGKMLKTAGKQAYIPA